MMRQFEYQEAVLSSVPLLIGLDGPSGSGKTFSALRLATGMQRVTGGDIGVIDTESRRALHYAPNFKFHHVPFTAPFSPLDYLEVIEHCVAKKVGVLIVDSMSHEHEGPGGVLEWHEQEMGGDYKKSIGAWAKPKAARRRLINTILQLGVNAIFCFRAKEKLRVVEGKPPIPQGWMPIGGEEFIYEMTVNCLLYPNSGGVPTWQPDKPGERQMVKLPEHFREIFKASKPLDEEIGQRLAEWAAGDEVKSAAQREAQRAVVPPHVDIDELLEWISTSTSAEAVKNLGDTHKDLPWTDEQKARLRKAMEKAYAKFGRTPTGREKRMRQEEPAGPPGPEALPDYCNNEIETGHGRIVPCSLAPGHDGDCAP